MYLLSFCHFGRSFQRSAMIVQRMVKSRNHSPRCRGLYSAELFSFAAPVRAPTRGSFLKEPSGRSPAPISGSLEARRSQTFNRALKITGFQSGGDAGCSVAVAYSMPFELRRNVHGHREHVGRAQGRRRVAITLEEFGMNKNGMRRIGRGECRSS